ncbi:MAG: hypothetical protein ACAH12_09650 [Methylophilaceae bacterium]
MPVTFSYIDSGPQDWKVSLSSNGKRKHKNLSKYNLDRSSNKCRIVGCINTFKTRGRMTGVCDVHKKHTSDLILTVSHSASIESLPGHIEIIEKLLEWSKSTNSPIDRFIEKLIKSIIGNIPEISTLAGMTPLSLEVNIDLKSLFEKHVVKVVDEFFEPDNLVSYLPLTTKKGTFPARILALALASLMFCEEANRGDRWFYRHILKDESKTTKLGGAMTVAYYAARQFKWGMDMQKPLGSIFR